MELDSKAGKFFGTGSQAWIRTGELGKCDNDGYLWHQGRAEDRQRAAPAVALA